MQLYDNINHHNTEMKIFGPGNLNNEIKWVVIVTIGVCDITTLHLLGMVMT